MNGGTTTEGHTRTQGARPAVPEPAASSQLVQVLTSLDQRLRGVEDWATQLEVAIDLLDLDRKQTTLKKMQASASINKN